MFIYHFNRMIRNKYLWGTFAIFISVIFAVDMDSCIRGDQTVGGVSGKLNGKSVSLREIEEISRSLRGTGRNRDNTTPASVIERRAWEQVAAGQTAAKAGLAPTKIEIVDMLKGLPAFQGPNGFDIRRYNALLREQGMNAEMFERDVARRLAMMKDAALVGSATWVAPMELTDEIAGLTDSFTVQVATFSNAFLKADMKLAEKDYQKFYEENTNSFALPDQMSVRYVSVPVTNYLAYVSVPEDDMRDYYDAHHDDYKRTTTNKTEELIPFEEVKGKIKSLLEKEEAAYCAQTSVTFRIYSRLEDTNQNALTVFADKTKLPVKQSPLFSERDTLSFISRADSKVFTDAAYELDPESGDSRFGIAKGTDFIYVLEQTKFVKAHVPAFKEVLEDLKPRAVARARSDAFEEASKSAKKKLEKALADGKSFADAAKAQSLNVSTQLTYTVNNIQKSPFPNSFSVAYGAMKVAKGKVSDPIPASADTALFVYVVDRKPGEALTADMMRAQIRENIARRRGDLFDEWLTWNLKRQKIEKKQALNFGDDVPAADDGLEDD